MELTEILHPRNVLVPLRATTERGAVLTLLDHLREGPDVAHPELLERLSTDERIRDVIHVGDRVLLPHLRTDAVDGLVAGLGIAPEPLQIESGTGEGALVEGTASVVLLVLAPPQATQLYLQVVASLARVLRTEDVVEQLLRARTPEAVLAIPELRQLVIHPRLAVRDVMTQRVHRVFPETSVREALNLMLRHHLNAVPVVGSKREVLGMVTEREVLRHLQPSLQRADGADREAAESQRPGGETQVREVMSRSVMCVSEEQGLAEVISIMINKDVERLPVVSEGKLSGFLTRGDILRKLFAS